MTLDRFVYSFFERFPQVERQQIDCSPSLQFRSKNDPRDSDSVLNFSELAYG
jgi:hypothetical protein